MLNIKLKDFFLCKVSAAIEFGLKNRGGGRLRSKTRESKVVAGQMVLASVSLESRLANSIRTGRAGIDAGKDFPEAAGYKKISGDL